MRLIFNILVFGILSSFGQIIVSSTFKRINKFVHKRQVEGIPPPTQPSFPRRSIPPGITRQFTILIPGSLNTQGSPNIPVSPGIPSPTILTGRSTSGSFPVAPRISTSPRSISATTRSPVTLGPAARAVPTPGPAAAVPVAPIPVILIMPVNVTPVPGQVVGTVKTRPVIFVDAPAMTLAPLPAPARPVPTQRLLVSSG